MRDDFDLIVHKLDKELPYINVYPIGDLHIGSGNFSEKAFRRWKNMVEEDEFAKVVIVGDMLDNGLKTSKTNSFEATMQPWEQKKWLTKEFESIKDKIIGAVQGNHEYRSTLIADAYPLYDVLAKLDLEHVYRQNMAFLKINLGQRNATRQCSYVFTLAHGASKTRTNNFTYNIDGMDVFINGHVHQPESSFKSKIVIDSKNETVSLRDFVHITVPSFQELGGYSLRALYQAQSSNVIPVIRLNGRVKDVVVKWV